MQLSSVIKSTTVGWIVKLTQSRITKVRMAAWNVINVYLDENVIEMFPSLVETAFGLVRQINEAVGVQTLGFIFLQKLVEILRKQSIEGIESTQLENLGLSRKSFIGMAFEKSRFG